MKKYEFMYKLDRAIENFSAEDRADILNDYEEHFRIGFEKGKTEEEICSSLGNPEDLASSYLEGQAAPQANKGYQNSSAVKPERSSGSRVIEVIGIIAFILFIGFPVLGSLFGIICGLGGSAIGLGIAGIVLMVASFFLTSHIIVFAGLFLLGIALTALGILLGFATYYAAKGIFKLIKYIFEYIEKSLRG